MLMIKTNVQASVQKKVAGTKNTLLAFIPCIKRRGTDSGRMNEGGIVCVPLNLNKTDEPL